MVMGLTGGDGDKNCCCHCLNGGGGGMNTIVM